MTTQFNRDCTAMDQGRNLPLFELDLLSAEEREQFEQHIMVCDHCRAELEQNRAYVPALREHRQELIDHLRSLNAGILGVREGTRAAESPWWRGGARSRTSLRLLIGTAALLVAAIVFWPSSTNVPTKSLALVSPEPLGYQKFTARDLTSEAERMRFDAAMDDYLRGDYRRCAAGLAEILRRNPSAPSARLYLGVCYDLMREPRLAISTLDPLVRDPQSPYLAEGRWYLAQAYALAGETSAARAILHDLIAGNGKFSGEASALLKRLE